jgi:hypothetical protein
LIPETETAYSTESKKLFGLAKLGAFGISLSGDLRGEWRDTAAQGYAEWAKAPSRRPLFSISAPNPVLSM